MSKSARLSGNPAKAAEQLKIRAENDAARAANRTGTNPAHVEEPQPGALRRFGAWFTGWFPFWVIGLATTIAMFTVSVRTDGHLPSILSVFLVPLAFTFFLMPFPVFMHRVWRWAVVFGLTVVTETSAAFIVSIAGIAWLMHQTYRVEHPRTSRIHLWVEAAREKWRNRRGDTLLQ